MGRKTFESLPKKLPDREHLILSRDNYRADPDLYFVSDLEAFIEAHQNTEEEIFIIGGGSVYVQMLPYATKMYLTEVNARAPKADVFFPKFNKSEWNRKVISKQTENGLNYVIAEYTRIESPA
jgi:dihydrofolate reductase